MNADGEGSSVLTLAPSLRWDGRRASAFAYGSWANFSDGAWSAQGGVGASLYGPSVLGLHPELSTIVTGTQQDGGDGTNQWSGEVRLHYWGRQVGMWGGGAVGRADDGMTSRAVSTAEIGAWTRANGATMVITAMSTWLGDTTLRHSELVGAGRIERGRLDVTASGGLRIWSRPDTAPAAAWIGANVTLWLSSHLAVLMGASTYPADWAQGLPSGRFAALGLRLATRRPTTRRDIGPRLLPPTVAPVVPAFEAVPSGDGRWTLRIRAPAAERLEVMGDFTRWEPVALERESDGRWAAAFTLAPGVHRLNLRMNGGPWGVPPGLPILEDDFGGVVAVLIVEQ